MRSGSVLVVEDEFLIVELLTTVLGDMGIEVCATAATADEAVGMARVHLPTLVLMDVRLKGPRDGIDAATIIRQAVGASVIFITGSGDSTTIARIERDHPAPVLYKPIRFDQFRTAVLHALG